MDFEEFSDRAVEIVAAVPEGFLRGVTGVLAHREAREDPEIPGSFFFGECGDDEVAALTEPEALRSRIHLYWGSFAAIARNEPDFDWDGELIETILHELRHHLEDRAGILDLRIEDELDAIEARLRAGLA
ncbi:MAG: metallopeptidase family protein [Planctomycetota bacterium]